MLFISQKIKISSFLLDKINCRLNLKMKLELEKVEIKNFRSIKHAIIPLNSFNIFAGINGSGKSNFIKAIEVVIQRVEIRYPELVKLIFLLPEFPWSLNKNIVYSNPYPFPFEKENDTEIKLYFKEGYIHTVFRYKKESIIREDTVKLPGWEIKKDSKFIEVNGQRFSLKEGEVLLSPFNFQITQDLKKQIENSIKFIDPQDKLNKILWIPKSFLNKLKQSKNPRLTIKNAIKMKKIDRDTGLLLLFFTNKELRENLLSIFREAFTYTKISRMSLKSPSFFSVSLSKEEEKFYEIIFVEEFMDREVPISLMDLPDGVKTFLTIWLEILDCPKNATLMIEEPENRLHVTAIRKLADLLIEYAEKKNLKFIITTHSPDFVRRFLPQDIIRVTRDVCGASHFHRITDDEALSQTIESLAEMPSE